MQISNLLVKWIQKIIDLLQGRGMPRPYGLARKNMTDTENKEQLEDMANVDSPNDTELENNEATNAVPEMDEAAFAKIDEMMKRMQRADELERELSEWKTRYVRLQDDFENYRRRTAEDAKEAKTVGAAEAIETLLGTYDDISRATDAGVKDPATLIPGLQNVRENFLKNLEKYGAVMVAGKDSVFDPNVHEALQVIPGAQDDIVLEVFQAGFTLNGKLIRPARVIVSKQMN
jgi:molecular chaperone GrpE